MMKEIVSLVRFFKAQETFQRAAANDSLPKIDNKFMQISVKFSQKRGTTDELEVQWTKRATGDGKR